MATITVKKQKLEEKGQLEDGDENGRGREEGKAGLRDIPKLRREQVQAKFLDRHVVGQLECSFPGTVAQPCAEQGPGAETQSPRTDRFYPGIVT